MRLADCLDLCPLDPNKVAPGACGCGIADIDSDGDGVPDCHDACPGHPDSIDSDGDGVPDACDTCPGFPDRIDCNRNGIADGCDIQSGDSLDLNHDGVPDECQCAADIAPIGGDGAVNVDDLLLVIAAWGTNNQQFDIAPPGGNGIVNVDEASRSCALTRKRSCSIAASPDRNPRSNIPPAVLVKRTRWQSWC